MRTSIALLSLTVALFIGLALSAPEPTVDLASHARTTRLEYPDPARAAEDHSAESGHSPADAETLLRGTLEGRDASETEAPVPVAPWDLPRTTTITADGFAYSRLQPPIPLPASALALLQPQVTDQAFSEDTFIEPRAPINVQLTDRPAPTRAGVCSAIVAVARANELPVTFLANLIWQESSFRLQTISGAGALGIAQFMPDTANERGLVNPFEPVHALFTAGRMLKRLQARFGNLGLAAAAYNAGPQRVSNWINGRDGLPAETRDYVIRITGRPARDWTTADVVRDPEATLMPARAPCQEVAEEVQQQTQYVRVARLMLDLTAATAPPPPAPSTNVNSNDFIGPKIPADVLATRAREATLRAWQKIKDKTIQLAAREFATLASSAAPATTGSVSSDSPPRMLPDRHERKAGGLRNAERVSLR